MIYQRSLQKRSKTNEHTTPQQHFFTDGNIINHRRGENNETETYKKLRVLEALRTDDTKITCCNFGTDQENLFPEFFSVMSVRSGKIETVRTNVCTAK